MGRLNLRSFERQLAIVISLNGVIEDPPSTFTNR
jgi:hypothetical protein